MNSEGLAAPELPKVTSQHPQKLHSKAAFVRKGHFCAGK